MLRIKSLSTLVLLVLLASKTLAQLEVPPGLSWRTMETEHFLIHFPKAHAELASTIAVKAEKVHSLATSVLQHTPTEKTHIVVSDYYDQVFGAAAITFYNTIYVGSTQHTVGLGHYEDFLTFVLLHEYCHIIDMDMIGGIPEIARTILGRFYSPNAFCPIWMIEGFATFFETELTNGGRGVDPFYDMYLRMAFLEDEVNHLDQNNLFLDRWPGGTSPYLYGESLYRYMARENNTRKVILFRHDNSKKLWPFSFGGSLGYYWGGSITDMYQRWRVDLQRRYQLQKKEIEHLGITPAQRLTHSGCDAWGIEWAPDDKELLFFNRTYDEHAFLKSVDVQSKAVKKLARVNSLYPQLSLDEEGENLYFAQLEVYNKSALYSDIYFLKMNPSHRVRRVTSKKRAFDPDINSLGEMIYVTNRQGMTDLCLRERDGREVVLIEGSEGMHFSNPRFSPDGKMIALSVWQRGGLRDIWIYRMDKESFVPVTQDGAWDITPCWSRDGRFILFSSDRTGVYNLFAYRIEDGAFFRLTNVLGGAFCPRISHDGGKIAFVGYSSGGFDVYAMQTPDIESLSPVDPGESLTRKRELFVYGYDEEPRVTADHTPAGSDSIPDIRYRKYNPLGTLLKPVRFPFLTVDDTSAVLGVYLLGQDVLNQHFYGFLAAYSVGHRRPAFSFDYLNAQLYPYFLLHAEDFIYPRGTLETSGEADEDIYWERIQNYFLGFEIPIRKLDRALYFGAGVGLAKYTEAEASTTWEQSPFFRGRLGYWFAGAGYSDAHRYPRSISYEEGISIEAGFQQYTEKLSSDLAFRHGQLAVHKYLRMPGTKHHVVLLRFLGEATNLQDLKSDLYLLSESFRGFKEIDWRKNLYGGSIEYRFPLFNVQRGYSTWPIYFRQVHWSFFTDYWRYYDTSTVRKELACSGMELSCDLGAIYRIPLSLTLGYAQPWKGDEDTFSLKVYWGISLGMGIKPKLRPSSSFNKVLPGRKF